MQLTLTREHLTVMEGICEFRPRGRCTLVEAVDLINHAIAYCRSQGLTKLLIDTTGLVGVPIPSLVDRFLMMEDWAESAKAVVVVVLVVHNDYIHPEKFGVKVAADLGLMGDVYSSEADALKWLATVSNPI